MSARTFRGGTHPYEHKELTRLKPIEHLTTAKQVVIHLNQHAGAPNQALVAVGDRISRGQKLAGAEARMWVPHHASISGVVKKIENRPQSNLADGVAVVIEADGRADTDFMPPLDPFTATKEEIVGRIRDAGIVGMGGAGFPTWVKLSPPPGKTIDLVIANGAECEPYLTIDYRTMLEEASKVVYGLAVCMKTAGVTRGVVAVEDNKADLETPLQEASAAFSEGPGKGLGFDIGVRILRTKYPQGGEKMLITAITGREVPSGGLPMDVGTIVQNVGSLVAIAEAFLEGKPLLDRGFTVTGGACASPKNLKVPIGTLLSDLIPDHIQLNGGLRRLVFGGPMMGVSVPTLETPIQKNTSGILMMNAAEARYFEDGSCIRCGRCMRACSCRLSPALLNEAIVAGDWERADDLGLLDCIECGTCSYVCPAHVQLVQRFRVGKPSVRNLLAQKAAKAKEAS